MVLTRRAVDLPVVTLTLQYHDWLSIAIDLVVIKAGPR